MSGSDHEVYMAMLTGQAAAIAEVAAAQERLAAAIERKAAALERLATARALTPRADPPARIERKPPAKAGPGGKISTAVGNL